MFNKFIEKEIIAHCKNYDYLNEFKGLKLLTIKFRENVECYNGVNMTKFDAVCSFKAKKYENNRVKFEVNIYDDPNGEQNNNIGVYFNGTYYVA